MAKCHNPHTGTIQTRTLLRNERAKKKEQKTRKERSMAEAKAALAATYAKYGIKPLAEKPVELPKHVPLDLKPRRKLTPESAAQMRRWLEKSDKRVDP